MVLVMLISSFQVKFSFYNISQLVTVFFLLFNCVFVNVWVWMQVGKGVHVDVWGQLLGVDSVLPLWILEVELRLTWHFHTLNHLTSSLHNILQIIRLYVFETKKTCLGQGGVAGLSSQLSRVWDRRIIFSSRPTMRPISKPQDWKCSSVVVSA